MSEQGLLGLVSKLRELPNETECVEFKVNYADPCEIGEYISALSNSATLQGKNSGYVVWGIDGVSHEIVGTTFAPRKAKVGNEELENWLARLVAPGLDFCFREAGSPDGHIVLLEVPKATHIPIRFKGVEYIRCGSYKKKLRDHPEKERALWKIFEAEPFEKRLAMEDLGPIDVTRLIDIGKYFDLTGTRHPSSLDGTLSVFEKAGLVGKTDDGRYAIKNLGAILLAKNLGRFEKLARKALRVVIYEGKDRTAALRQQEGEYGYALGFEGAYEFILAQLPENEIISRALREKVRIYPAIAIRELLSNALIHQDFEISGTGPTVEIFSDRLEITNSGKPLIETLRFIDAPPLSRNESLASLMRRMHICEELGTGIDKTLAGVELYQLPAPDFLVIDDSTRIILYESRTLSKMSKEDKVRACYWHACLRYVRNEVMDNSSLRKRLGIEDSNYPTATRIINDTISEGLVKPHDPDSKSRKYARYVPYWA